MLGKAGGARTPPTPPPWNPLAHLGDVIPKTGTGDERMEMSLGKRLQELEVMNRAGERKGRPPPPSMLEKGALDLAATSSLCTPGAEGTYTLKATVRTGSLDSGGCVIVDDHFQVVATAPVLVTARPPILLRHPPLSHQAVFRALAGLGCCGQTLMLRKKAGQSISCSLRGCAG
ncbi:hypothetical protein H8959_022426 [Pygathrix nigripes]